MTNRQYLRKSAVATRYGVTPRNVERMAKDGRIPPPTIYMGRLPLWDQQTLDENDRAAAARPRPTQAA
jgi:hypothetical protein